MNFLDYEGTARFSILASNTEGVDKIKQGIDPNLMGQPLVQYYHQVCWTKAINILLKFKGYFITNTGIADFLSTLCATMLTYISL